LLLTLSDRRQVKDNFIILRKIEYSNVFRCRSGNRQRTEFLKTDSESIFPDGSGHMLLWQKPVCAAAKPLGSVPPFSRQVFSAQESARQKLKIRPEPSGNKLSESVFKNFVRCL
jgi:hypothetical protein